MRSYRHMLANRKAKQRHADKPKAIKMAMELVGLYMNFSEYGIIEQ